MAIESASASRPFDLPINTIADHLLTEQARVLEAPQSFPIQLPKTVEEIAMGLERLTHVPYEFMITHEPLTNRWILSTGAKYHAVQVLDGKLDAEIGRRINASNFKFIHNHPELFGERNAPPSPGDLETIAWMSKKLGKPHTSLILTPVGAVRYGYVHDIFPVEVTLAWKGICKKRKLDTLISDERKLEQHFQQYMEAHHELIDVTGALYEMYPWRENEYMTQGILAQFFEHPS